MSKILAPGFDKLLLFPGQQDGNIFTFAIEHERRHLEKTASEYHPLIARYINEAKPISGITQILLTALGSYETWGDNTNGDAFEEKYLAPEREDWGHKTFETLARIYKHHVNKDPSASFGRVAKAVYNPAYKRVELIVLLDNAKAPDILGRMESGQYDSWSMGCRVPYDICSICGNRAPNRRHYCDHLKYYMGRIDPETGRKAFAFNPYPKFFDISQVLIGADRIARTLKKVASTGGSPVLSSAWLAEKSAEVYGTKKADMVKEIPAEVAPESKETLRDLAESLPEIKASEPDLPREVVDRLAARPLREALATLAGAAILPKPQEFQRIILIRLGKPELADELDQDGICFDPEMAEKEIPEGCPCFDNFNESLFEDLRPHMETRSAYAPFLGNRMTVMAKHGFAARGLPKFVKTAEDLRDERKPVGVLPMLMAAAGLYAAFSRGAPKEGLKGLDALLNKSPGLAAALGVGMVGTFGNMFGSKQKGRFDQIPMQPNQDIYSRIEELKQKPITKVAGPAAKRLFLGIPAMYMASGVLQKHKDINPYEQEGRIKSFVRKYPDVISGALIADAMLALRGKGTHGVLKGLARKLPMRQLAKTSSQAKTADLRDTVINSAVWPLVLKKGNLPARMLTSFLDQAALDSLLNKLPKQT